MAQLLAFNCPYCGQVLAHQATHGDWRFYRCGKCGPITLPPGGRHRRTEATDYVAGTARTSPDGRRQTWRDATAPDPDIPAR